jgi:hypothetical membrane protein
MDARLAAACGIAAPASFVGGWLLAGVLTDDYSPVTDHISDLAAVGATTRPLMTAALVSFGVLLPVFGVALGRSLGSNAVRTAVVTSGVTTLGVAALPLGASFGNGPHAVAAGAGYVATALSPLLAAPFLTGRARTASRLTGLASATLLTASTMGHAAGGLQRAGLGVVDVWFAVMAVRELRRR